MSLTMLLSWYRKDDDGLAGEVPLDFAQADVKTALGDLSEGELRDVWDVTTDNHQAMTKLTNLAFDLDTFHYQVAVVGG